MQHIPFSNNYKDHSTDSGFRFEFFCEKCHDGYMTEFNRYGIGTINNLLEVGENLFGGFFHQASRIAERVRSADWEQARDKAFIEAVEEGKKQFYRCSRCGNYFCKNCWNPDEGLCANCAPFISQEIEAAKRRTAIEQVHQKVRKIEYIKEEDLKNDIQVTCPECSSPTGKGKFCANCGAKLGEKNHCPKCNVIISKSAKFCPECGFKII